MDYRIDFDNPLEDEVRRIASEQLINAAELLEKQPDGPHEAIHDARKSIKRTRALYRLVASDAGTFTETENQRLRDIARELSRLRDTAALVESTEYLEGETGDKRSLTAIRKLGRAMRKQRDAVENAEADIQEKIATAAAGLREAVEALDELQLPQLRKQAIDCLSTGWKKISRKAWKALEACRESDHEETFHDLRKRAQDRWMHAALMRQVWPAGMASIQKATKALVDILGHEHDLSVLTDHVGGHADAGNSDADRATLNEAISAQRKKLQKAAVDTAEEIFDRKPKRDARIVAMLIKSRD